MVRGLLFKCSSALGSLSGPLKALSVNHFLSGRGRKADLPFYTAILFSLK